MTLSAGTKLGPYEIVAPIYRLDLSTGKRELFKELVPLDPAGIDLLSPPALTLDGKSFVYSYNRILSDLFLAEGIR